MRIALVAAFVAACSSCATFQKLKPYDPLAPVYVSDGVERIVKSAVRIRIYCDGQLLGYGSGTAISPRYLLTARHISQGCQSSETPDMGTFTAQFDNGEIYEIITAKESAEVDTALMVVAGSNSFPAWAPLADYQPSVGQRVWVYAGDGTIDGDGEYAFQIKDGLLSHVLAGLIVVSAHGVPGNSGCGVFDEDGNLLGVLWGGSWNASREFYFEAYRPQAWPELIPGPSLSGGSV